MPKLKELEKQIREHRQRGILYRCVLLDEWTLAGIAGAILLLLALGGVAGWFIASRNLGVEGELRRARAALSNNFNGAQSEMTTVSEFQVHLASMELYFTEYRIWNQPDYKKIETDFQRNCETWNKRFDAERQKPSEFEGGSLAPMDKNLQMIDLIETRIKELNTKWRKE